MRNSGKKSANIKYYIAGGTFILVLVIIFCLVFIPGAPLNKPQAPAEKTTSSFMFYSAVDGEQVGWVEGSIWIPKSTATFDETEDIYTLTKFQEQKSSIDIKDISIDLREVDYAWLEVDPDAETVFANHYILLYGGRNYDYSFYVYDLTTDVNFNLLDEDTLAIVDLSGDNVTLTGGYVIPMDCPHNTTTAAQLHVGDDWEMDDDDFDDLSITQQEWYYDEKNVAGQYPYYSPVVDLEKDYYEDLEKLTNAFVLKFYFNNTISTEDGNTAQVNCTINSDVDVEVVISGTYIFFIWTEGFDFEDGVVSINFDMDTGTAIGLDDIDSGRLVVPYDDQNLGAFTKYSDIGA